MLQRSSRLCALKTSRAFVPTILPTNATLSYKSNLFETKHQSPTKRTLYTQIALNERKFQLHKMKLGLKSIVKRNMWIQTQGTPNPESLKFLPEETVLGTDENGSPRTLHFSDAREAMSSPVAKKLFQIQGVKGVFFGSDFVTITKEEDSEWGELKPQVFASLTEAFAKRTSFADKIEDTSGTAILEDDDEVVALIKEILETRVRPAVQEDGGDIQYLGFEDGVVFLKMQGSCSGCPSSSLTLKSGIEKMLRHWVPEVSNVMALEDEELERLNLDQFKKTEKMIEEQTA